MGITPADYIRKYRPSKSALTLRDNPRKIAEVAFEMGFRSVDRYQRAFSREFGWDPSEYASMPVPLYLFTPYGVKFRHIERSPMVENLRNVFVRVTEKPERRVLVKRGVRAADYFAYCEEVGCDIWGLLQSIPSIDGEPVCLWFPATYQKPGTSEYAQGLEVPADYDGGQAIEEVQASIKRYSPSNIGYSWDDSNPRIQLEPIGTRGYIELMAIKQA